MSPNFLFGQVRIFLRGDPSGAKLDEMREALLKACGSGTFDSVGVLVYGGATIEPDEYKLVSYIKGRTEIELASNAHAVEQYVLCAFGPCRVEKHLPKECFKISGVKGKVL